MVSMRLLLSFGLVALISACGGPPSKSARQESITIEGELLPASEDIVLGDIVQEPAPLPPPAPPITDSHNIALKVDFVFALGAASVLDEDNTAMVDKLTKLLGEAASRFDYQVYVLSDALPAFPAGIDPLKVANIQEQVRGTDAITHLNNLFAGNYDESYVSFDGEDAVPPLAFRKDAKLEVIIIADDNAEDEAGNLAVDFDPNKTLKATVRSVVGLPTTVPVEDVCEPVEGVEYATLAKNSLGSSIDLCAPDWAALAAKITADQLKSKSSFTLSKKPADPKALVVNVDGKDLPADAWSYDADRNALTLLKTETLKSGSVVKLSYVAAAAG